jgi:hypothetical protein
VPVGGSFDGRFGAFELGIEPLGVPNCLAVTRMPGVELAAAPRESGLVADPDCCGAQAQQIARVINALFTLSPSGL